jgi:ATP synthase F1 gamma subunit
MFSSRNAMDNAQKNASDMISALQMKYNRGRQAAITNELVDIITGKFRIIMRQAFYLKIACPGASAL